MSEVSINGQDSSINRNVSFNTFYTYSFINNGVFYPLIPTPYYDYYNRFVRHYFYWYDGFVPSFHSSNSGIFSTRLAYTLCNKLASLINGGSLMFDNPEPLSKKRLKYNERDTKPSDALEFIEKWAYDVNLTNKNNTAIEYALAGGDSIYKLNSSGNDLYPTILRKDNYLLDIDFRGDVIGFEGLVYTLTETTKGDTNTQQKQNYYYVLEERKYNDKGEPQYRLYVKAGYGNLTTNRDIDFEKIQRVKFEELPRYVKKAIKDGYGNIKLDKWYDLPLNSLGIYQMKASDGVSFVPQMPFGESILSNIISYLMSYDYYFSALNTDMYLGRGRVLLPKPMQSPQQTEMSASYFSGLDDGVYNMAEYVDPQQQKPHVFQFDIRGNDWDTVGKMLLRYIAMSLSISERTLSNFLTDGSERATAREISVDDATATFVENKRTLFRKPLNKMLQEVLDFYEFDDEILVRFSRVGLNNINEVVQQVVTLKQNGLLDTMTGLEMVYVDKNQRQLEEMKSAIDTEQEKLMKKEVEQKGTTDEDYEQENNNDISHVKNEE